VTLSVPAHPTAEQARTLQRRIVLQAQARTGFWSLVRAGLGSAHDRPWPRPQIILPAVRDALHDLVPPDDLPGRQYIDCAVEHEAATLRRLPTRVDQSHLRSNADADLLLVPTPLLIIGEDLLLLPDFNLEVDGFALPRPFREVLPDRGTTRLVKWRAQLVDDLERWDQSWGDLPVADHQRLQRHVDHYGPWCTGPVPVLSAVPGVEAQTVSVQHRYDRAGVRRWVCDITFTLSPDALRTWFPEATVSEPVGIDPGLRHPLTWASANAAHSLSPALVDLSGFPGRQGPGARALRRACWTRHAVGYDRAWKEILQHRTVRLEDTHWTTLTRNNPDFVRRAQDNYLFCWLDHLAATAPLTGAVLEMIPSRETSLTCSECGYVHDTRQEGVFVCENQLYCHYSAPVDVNAAHNIAQAMHPRRSHLPKSEPSWQGKQN